MATAVQIESFVRIRSRIGNETQKRETEREREKKKNSKSRRRETIVDPETIFLPNYSSRSLRALLAHLSSPVCSIFVCARGLILPWLGQDVLQAHIRMRENSSGATNDHVHHAHCNLPFQTIFEHDLSSGGIPTYDHRFLPLLLFVRIDFMRMWSDNTEIWLIPNDERCAFLFFIFSHTTRLLSCDY